MIAERSPRAPASGHQAVRRGVHLKIMWADGGYGRAPIAAFVKTAAAITLEVVKRTSPHAFQVVRRRWVVERTFGWLMRYRRSPPGEEPVTHTTNYRQVH